MHEADIFAKIDAALEVNVPQTVYPAATHTEYLPYPAVTGDDSDPAKAVIREVVSHYGGGKSGIWQRFPNGSLCYLNSQGFLEFRTAPQADALDTALDDRAGQLVSSEIYGRFAGQQRSRLYRRAGWEHAGSSGSATYAHAHEVAEAGVGRLMEAPRLLSSWGAVKDLLFGAGIVGKLSGQSTGFRFGQKEAGIGVEWSSSRTSEHGKKPLLILKSGYGSSAVHFNVDPLHSVRLTRLAVGAGDLMLRLALDRMAPQGLPHLRNPIMALHTVSADMGLRRTLRTQQGRRATALDLLRAYGEAGIALGDREELPAATAQAARFMLEISDRLEKVDLPSGDLQGLEDTLVWARKYHTLYRLLDGDISRMNSVVGADEKAAVAADLKFDEAHGSAAAFWRRIDALPLDEPEALRRRLKQS